MRPSRDLSDDVVRRKVGPDGGKLESSRFVGFVWPTRPVRFPGQDVCTLPFLLVLD